MNNILFPGMSQGINGSYLMKKEMEVCIFITWLSNYCTCTNFTGTISPNLHV